MRSTRRAATALLAASALTSPAAAYAGPGAGSSAEIAEIAKNLTKAFEDYRAANDNRLTELEKKGTVTPEMRATMEKADKAIDALKDSLAQATKDQQKRIDELELELGRRAAGGGNVVDLEERRAAARFYTAATGKRVRANAKDLDLDKYRAYAEAFDALIRKQCHPHLLGSDIQNALSVGSDPDGGYLVPTETSMDMEKRIFDSSPMRQVARILSIGAGAWEAPYKASKGVSGGWVGERSARTATGTGTVGVQRIETHEQYAYPEATQTMLDDAAMNVEDFLVTDTEEEMTRTENTAFVTGDGVMKPNGFMSTARTTAAVTTADATRAWGLLQYIFTGNSGGFDSTAQANPLIDTIAALNPAYRPEARWAMNRSVEAAVRKLKDTTGRYLVGFGDLRDDVTGFNLLGFPIVNFEDMPNLAANSFSIAFGNWKRGYYVVDRIGFRVLRDPYTNKPYVGFYITKRTGGDIRNFDAIKLVKFGTS